MAKSTHDVPADWREVDPDSLPDNLAEAYAAYKSQQRLAAEARDKFETAMSAAVPIPHGQRLVFGYRFGKLSIAVVPDDKPKPKPTQSAATLADFLASARLAGARV